MGKFNAELKRAYWLSRALDGCVENPPADKKFSECTDEEKASRYLHRAYYLLTGDTFDRKAFNDMMKPMDMSK